MRHTSVLRLSSFTLCLLGATLSLHAQRGGGAPPSGGSSPTASISMGGASDHSPNVRNRRLIGAVRDTDGKAVLGAIVYLKNVQTNQVESMIADDHGAYRFGDLSLTSDYVLWAETGKKKGPTKSISSYDTRDELSVNLKVE